MNSEHKNKTKNPAGTHLNTAANKNELWKRSFQIRIQIQFVRLQRLMSPR